MDVPLVFANLVGPALLRYVMLNRCSFQHHAIYVLTPVIENGDCTVVSEVTGPDSRSASKRSQKRDGSCGSPNHDYARGDTAMQ